MLSVLPKPHSRGGWMSHDAFPPACNPRRSHQADLSRYAILITLVSSLLFLAGCSGFSTASPASSSNNPPAIAVTVSPATATIVSAGTQQFSALVTNTSNTAVTWSASPGTISSMGLYQAPSVTVTTHATVTATSVADPTKSGTASVTITAGSSNPGPLSITTKSLPAATAGTAYSSPLNATGGNAPYSWSLASGTLPTGIAVNSAGSVSGTTTQTGQFNFTVQVSDSSSPKQTATQPLVLTVNSSTSGGNNPPASYWGFSESDTNGGGWPTVSYGMQRFWDSPPLQWPSINTASGVFDFTSLDSDLALAYSRGTMEGMYTLARTPPWATSDPTDTSCADTTGMGGGDGECDPPSDLNSDGSGANAIWKAWITAIATHVNSAGYTATHAHIKYWEIWNEPDTTLFWRGSIAQLARLTEDANCIITGRGVIHENGNGSATPCTATPIDPTAQIVMASAHAKGPALQYGQNELYCNNAPSGLQLPCPNPPNAIATAVDIINFHMKPGNETGNNCPAPTPCTPESAMQWYVSNIHGILQSNELAKPVGRRSAIFQFWIHWSVRRLRYGSLVHAALLPARLVARHKWHSVVLRRFPSRARPSRNLLSANLQLACKRDSGHSMRGHRLGVVLHYLHLWHPVPYYVGRLPKLRQRSMHHGESDSRFAMDAVSEHDHCRDSYRDLRRRSPSRDSARSAELASVEISQPSWHCHPEARAFAAEGPEHWLAAPGTRGLAGPRLLLSANRRIAYALKLPRAPC